MPGKLLIVDDETNMRESLGSILEEEGYSVSMAANGREALRQLEKQGFQVMVVDLKMPQMGGLEVLQRARQVRPETAVIVITGFPSVESALEAMKRGAYDYISKPFDPPELTLTIRRAVDHQKVTAENQRLRSALATFYRPEDLIGETLRMRQIKDLIKTVAPAESTVLIRGESGTGKELIAHAIHYHSQRREDPFLTVNCAAIPAELLESELFGHEKGAFTGAIRKKPGKFELAHGGTVYLDEIADMSPALQAKVLRVLQQKEFETVGGTIPIKVDVRIIAATNRDLEKAIREGTFREDLYYRVNVIRIEMPPLRERRGDIPLLAKQFLEDFSNLMHKPPCRLSPEAENMMLRYQWPGNVRELENMMERVVVLSGREVIGPEAFPPELGRGEAKARGDLPPPRSWEMWEKEILGIELERAGGNQKLAAKNLGIGRNTLWRKIRKYGLKSTEEGSP